MGGDQGGKQAEAANLIKQKTGVEVPTNALFDIQVKRIHEYKRQLLNVFGIIHRYNAPAEMTRGEEAAGARVCIVGWQGGAPDTTWRSASSSSCPRWETP